MAQNQRQTTVEEQGPFTKANFLLSTSASPHGIHLAMLSLAETSQPLSNTPSPLCYYSHEPYTTTSLPLRRSQHSLRTAYEKNHLLPTPQIILMLVTSIPPSSPLSTEEHNVALLVLLDHAVLLLIVVYDTLAANRPRHHRHVYYIRPREVAGQESSMESTL